MQNTSVHAVEHLLYFTLLQLIVIVAAARLFGAVARRVGQPRAVGEIFAGLLLGPSLFAALAPEAFAYVFESTDSLLRGDGVARGPVTTAPLLRLWLSRAGHVIPARREA